MPLHDVSYERFQGPRVHRAARIWALARTSLTLLLRQRRFLFLLAACWMPAIVRAVQIYLARQFPDSVPFLEVNPGLWKDFLTQQVRFLLVVAVALYAGSGSISADLRSGAAAIYLSKPITWMDYLCGKALPVGLALLSITVAPALALLGLHLGLTDDLSLVRENWWLPLSIIAYGVGLATYFTLTVLAVSSLSRSGRLAAAGFVLLVLGSEFLHGMMSQMSYAEAPPYISLVRVAVEAADLFFLEPRAATPMLCLITMVLWSAASIWVIGRRMRSTEVAA